MKALTSVRMLLGLLVLMSGLLCLDRLVSEKSGELVGHRANSAVGRERRESGSALAGQAEVTVSVGGKNKILRVQRPPDKKESRRCPTEDKRRKKKKNCFPNSSGRRKMAVELLSIRVILITTHCADGRI